MAHNINRNQITGKDSIVYAGATPWHRLGQPIAEAFDAETALKLGGLDFAVEKQAIQTVTGKPIPGRHATVRTDTGDVLGIVGDIYKPLQNREAFSFFDGLFGKGKARFEVAGALGLGEQVWILAKLPGDFSVIGEDVVGKYLLLTNGHDGNEVVRVRFTPIRVVCQNTLNAALRGTANEVRVQHIGKVEQKLEIAAKLLKHAGIFFDEAQARFQSFTKIKLNAEAFRGYATEVLTGERQKFEELHPVTRNAVSKIEEFAETGRGSDLKHVRGTLWGAYNAVTEYVDHSKTGDNLAYMARGSGLKIKTRAFELAEAMLAAN